LAVTVTGANLSAMNFSGTAQTFNLSGTITPSAGGAGASVALNGASSATTISSSSGNYVFSGLLNGNYAVTPSNTGYAFSPATQAVTINSVNVTSINFAAT